MTMVEKLLHGPMSWTDSAIMVIAMSGLEAIATRVIKNAVKPDETPPVEEVVTKTPPSSSKRTGIFRY